MATEQGLALAEEQLLWAGVGEMPPAAAAHSLLGSSPSPRTGRGNPHPSPPPFLLALWPSPSHPLSVHKVVTVPPDVFFFLGLKGVLLTLFTFIYYHSHFFSSPNWCQGSICA